MLSRKTDDQVRFRQLARWLATVASVGLVAAICAACGSSSGSSGSGGGGASAGNAKGMTTVSMVEDEEGFGNTALYVAQKEGFFTKNGIKVDLRNLGTGSTTGEVMQSGKVNVAVSATYEMGTLASQGAPLQAFSLYGNTPIDICVSKPFAQEKGLSSSSSLSTVFAALKGSKVGISGPNSAPDLIGKYLQRQYGHYDPTSAVQTISVGSHAALAEAVERNQVNVVFSSPPTCNIAVQAGKAVEVATSKQFSDLLQTPEYILYAKKSYLTSNPTVAKKINKALAEAEAFCRTHKSAVVDIMHGYFPSVPKPLMSKIYTSEVLPVIPHSPAMTASGWQRVSSIIKPATSSTLNSTEGNVWTNQYVPGS